MDGVLIDSEGFWQQAEKEIFTVLGCTWNDELAQQTTGSTIVAVVELWYKLYPWENQSITDVAQAIVNRVDELIRLEGKIKEGVLETLTFLQNNNIKIGLATNSSHDLIQTVLHSLSIASFFQTTVSADDVANGKPAPDVYLKACYNLKSKPSECLVIEDSFTGATAGKQANMTVFAVPEEIHYNDPKFDFVDVKLKSLKSFPETFNSLIHILS